MPTSAAVQNRWAFLSLTATFLYRYKAVRHRDIVRKKEGTKEGHKYWMSLNLSGEGG